MTKKQGKKTLPQTGPILRQKRDAFFCPILAIIYAMMFDNIFPRRERAREREREREGERERTENKDDVYIIIRRFFSSFASALFKFHVLISPILKYGIKTNLILRDSQKSYMYK